MVLPRPITLRASSIARFAGPARYLRTAELQPWQRILQRNGCRTYASGHGAHNTAKKSDLPWIATALAATVSGVYLVTQQDLGHGEGHHDEHHGEKHEEAPEEEEPEAKEEESKPESKEDEPNDESKDVSKGDDKQTEEKSPDKTDKADPRKQSKSQNEMSGKQEGLSNTDTKHTHDVSKEPEKSKKGEGVAESAKLKGTVSTDRPEAENKEERDKAQQDKSK